MAVITTIEDLRVLAQKRVPRNGMDTPNFTNSKFAVKVKVPSASALKQAAIDQHAFAGAFDQVARAGEAAAGAVKGKFHVDLRNSVVQLQGNVGEPPDLSPSMRGPLVCSPPVRPVA